MEKRAVDWRAITRRHPVLIGVLALALALTLVFALRLGMGAIYWASHEDEAVRPWMTVGYVGRSWDLDPREIDRRAGLPLPEGNPLTLQEIATREGRPVDEIIARVEATVARMRAEQAARHGGDGPGQVRP